MENGSSELNKDRELIEFYKDIADHANSQIDRVWKTYTLFGTILGTIISVGLLVIYFMYGDSYKELVQSIKDRTELVKQQIDKKIEVEFDKENISKIIIKAANNAAKEQVDKEKVQDIINIEVSNIVTEKISDLSNQLKILKDENENAIRDLSNASELYLILYDAAYEISSLKKLLEISKNKDHGISIIATKSYYRIVGEIEKDYRRISSDEWALKQVEDQYIKLSGPVAGGINDYINSYTIMRNDLKPVFIYKFFTDDSIGDEIKYNFAYSLLKIETQPKIIFTICALINEKAKINKNYLLETEEYLNWIESNT